MNQSQFRFLNFVINSQVTNKSQININPKMHHYSKAKQHSDLKMNAKDRHSHSYFEVFELHFVIFSVAQYE